jgi:hypothetical protein
MREQGDEAQGQEERDEDGHAQGDGEGAEELADHAGEKAQRREHDDGGEGGPDDGRHQLRRRLLDRVLLAASEVAVDVLHHHHRVVDDEANGDGQAPIDIRFTVSPKKRMKRNVETIVRGRVRAATSVIRQERRNTKRTTTASRPPMTMASGHWPIASDTNPARSYTLEMRRPEGRLAVSSRSVASTPSRTFEDVGPDLLRHVHQRRRTPVAGDERECGRARRETSPRSATRTTAPPLTDTGVCAISGTDAQRPEASTRYCSPPDGYRATE